MREEQSSKSMMQRWLFAAILLVIAAAFFYTYFARRELGFDPIQALPYEALMMEEDRELTMDISSSKIPDLESFFTKQKKDFDFSPYIIEVPKEWEAQGSSIIDYDFVKIAVTRFHNSSVDKSLFHFVFAGRLEELSPSSQGRLDHFLYQTYTSDKMNVIVWQHNPGTLAMLVARLRFSELAQLGAKSQ